MPACKSYYPSVASSLHSTRAEFDKYGRLTAIDGVVTNVYDLWPTFHETTGALNATGNAGNAYLAMTTDLVQGETARFGYEFYGVLKEKTVTDASDFTDEISRETFEYDGAKRLTKDTCTYDAGNAKTVTSTISYVKPENDPAADERVSEYTYAIVGTTVANTQNTYDAFNRIQSKHYAVGDGNFTKNLNYYKTRVMSENDSAGGTTSYWYENSGKLQSITTGGKLTKYFYDQYGQLVRENNKALDKTFAYSYDENGNLVGVSTYAYTTGAMVDLISSTTFGNTADRLTSYNGTTIAYNAMGCPTTYEGKTLTWSKGRLASMRKGTIATGVQNYSYTYNGFGQRIARSYSKLANANTNLQDGELKTSSKQYFYDHSGRLIAETCTRTYNGAASETENIVYLYDESGIIGMVYTLNGATATYYFHRNLLGDVIGIYDTSGTLVAKYIYDAWGNCTISGETTNNALAHANPIRYRGYYYDDDTGLYYLNARYYSPKWRRFISPDDTAYLDPDSPNGLNLYCYCNNDPVNYADPSGYFPILALVLCGMALTGVGLSIGGVASDNNTLTAIGLGMLGLAAVASGGIAIAGAVASGATLTGIIGGVTAIAGVGSLTFMSAEIQEATGNGNWIMDITGMSDGLYNTLLLSTASFAAVGTVASSVAHAFDVKSISEFGKINGSNYRGMKFTQRYNGSDRIMSIEFHHGHIHRGRKLHWQLNKWSKAGKSFQRGVAWWDILLRRIY